MDDMPTSGPFWGLGTDAKCSGSFLSIHPSHNGISTILDFHHIERNVKVSLKVAFLSGQREGSEDVMRACGSSENGGGGVYTGFKRTGVRI